MMKLKFLMALLLFSAFGALQAVAQPPAPSVADAKIEPQQQIKNTLGQFVAVLADANFLQAQSFVVGSRFGFFGSSEWLRAWHDRYYPREIKLENVQIERLDGDEAVVNVSYRFQYIQGYAGPTDEEHKEKLHLRFAAQPLPGLGVGNKNWRIVVGTPDVVWKKDAASLERVALVIGQDKNLASQIRAEVAVWRLQKLERGLLQLRQDYGSYPFEPAYFEEALRAYMLPAKDNPFLVPGTTEKWAFNTRLCGQPEPWADEPRVVLLYDGANKKLNFRFDGKAAVCSDDGFGTVEFVTPAEAAKLRFQPQPKAH